MVSDRIHVVRGTRRRLSRAGAVVLALVALALSPSALSAQVPLDRPAHLVLEPTPLVDALRMLQERASVPIVYSPDLIPDVTVSCDCAANTVRQALALLLRGTELTYRTAASRILILPPSGRRSGPGVITGQVLDDTGTPVPSVVIHLETGQGVLADESGRYVLRDVPAGRHHLEVTGIGWEAGAHDILLEPGDTLAQVTRLRPAPVPLPEIVVAPGTFGILESVPPGTTRTITREEIEALPQMGEDVFRSLTRLAGVSAHDISTRLSVRGSQDRDVLVRLDGIELYEPYHLPEFDGVFGIVDLAALSSVELKAGGFGVEYGDGEGGVLDMKSRTSVAPVATTATLNLSHLSIASQGGFAEDRGSWLVSGRQGSLGLLFKLVGADRRLSPQFYDVFGKVAFQPTPGQLVTAHVLHAGDRFFLDVGEWDGITVGDGIEAGRIRSDWSSTYAWITWDAKVGRRLSTRTQIQAGRIARFRDGAIEDAGQIGAPEQIAVRDDRGFDFFGAREELRFEVSPNLMLRLGGEAKRTIADYDYFARTATPFLDLDGLARLRIDTLEVAFSPRGDRTAAFAAARGRAGPLTAELGLRLDHTTLPHESHVAPRLQVAYSITPATSLRASVGRYYQSQDVGRLQVGDGQTLYAPAERSDMVAVALEQRLGRGGKVRIEAYDRRISDQQPRFIGLEQELQIFPEQQGDRLRIDPDRGRSRGVEVFLEGRAGSSWRWGASYAFAKAEDEIPQTTPCSNGPTCLEDPWVPRSRDQRHTVNLQMDYRPNDRWNVAAAWTFHSGWPFTPWIYDAALRADGSPFFTRAFGPLRSLRLPAYHRLDLRATRTFSFGSHTLEAYADLFNVYDRRNRGSRRYALQYHGADDVRTVMTDGGEDLLPFLPMIGFRYRF